MNIADNIRLRLIKRCSVSVTLVLLGMALAVPPAIYLFWENSTFIFSLLGMIVSMGGFLAGRAERIMKDGKYSNKIGKRIRWSCFKKVEDFVGENFQKQIYENIDDRLEVVEILKASGERMFLKHTLYGFVPVSLREAEHLTEKFKDALLRTQKPLAVVPNRRAAIQATKDSIGA